MKKYLIVANWKMNKTLQEAKVFLEEFQSKFKLSGSPVDVIFCAPFTQIFYLNSLGLDRKFPLGAQNLHWEAKGAFTGEISGEMVKNCGADWVIVGHSERRQYFQETNEIIKKKLLAAFRNQLHPILCIGETGVERDRGETETVLKKQLEATIPALTKEQVEDLVIAYEPVWAIGTGRTPTDKQIHEVHQLVKKLVKDYSDCAETRVLYGGSVTPENSNLLSKIIGVDGFLVGGASLDPEKFYQIILSTIQNGGES